MEQRLHPERFAPVTRPTWGLPPISQLEKQVPDASARWQAMWEPGKAIDQALGKPATQGEAVAQGVAKLLADTMSLKSLLIMAAGGVAGKGVQAAANLPRVARFLTETVGLAPHVADAVARAAVPAVFTAMAGYGGVQEGIRALQTEGPERTEHLTTAFGNALLAALGAWGTKESAGAALRLGKAPELPYSGRTAATRAITGELAADLGIEPTRRMNPAEVTAMADAMEKSGNRLGAQALRAGTDCGRSDRAAGGEVEIGAGGGPVVPSGFLRISTGEVGLGCSGASAAAMLAL